MASLDILDGGEFPFADLSGFIAISRAANSWVFQNIALGRFVTLAGSGFDTGAGAAFPTSGIVTTFTLSVTQVPAGPAERVFTLAEMTMPAATLAAARFDPALLAAALLSGDDKVEMLGVDLSADARNGPVTLHGGAGADDVGGSQYADVVHGDAGNDLIEGRGGADTLVGGAGHDHLLGGDGNDSLLGGEGLDRLEGGAGNDTLQGEDGRDRLLGGAGDDLLDGGAGRDFMDGGAGNDTVLADANSEPGEVLRGGKGLDVLAIRDRAELDEAMEVSGFEELRLTAGTARLYLRAEHWGQFDLVTATAATDIDISIANPGIVDLSGADWLRVSVRSFGGSSGDDRVSGIGMGAILEPWNSSDDDYMALDDGNDTAFGDTGDDVLTGGAGNDWLLGEEDSDTLVGQEGADTLLGGVGDDRLDGGADADRLLGGAGADSASGGDGGDVIWGDDADRFHGEGGGDDTLEGGGGNDIIEGESGNDLIRGDDGEDTVLGSAGADTLIGGIGNDLMDGADGADSMSGGAGNDRMTSGWGADWLDGGLGVDTLTGGSAADTLVGGGGIDRFLYEHVTDTAVADPDRILDFNATGTGPQRDAINLSLIDANATTLFIYEAFAFMGNAGAFTAAGQLRLEAGPGGTVTVLLNTDADLEAEGAIIVTVVAGTLDATDFIL